MRISKKITIFASAFILAFAMIVVMPEEVSAATKKPGKVILSSVASSDYNAVKISWKKASNAKKYQVYRATAKKGKYKLVKTTTSRSYINTKLTTGKKYYYKVRAVNGLKKGTFSAIKYATPKLKKVYGVTAEAKNHNTVVVSWNKVNGAKGYQVYRSTSKNGTYKKVKSTTATSFTNTELTADKNYYYKIRAYRVVSGAYKYGSYSDIKKCTPGYSYEVYLLDDYESRGIYSECTQMAIYIKTIDPDYEDFDFITSTGEYVYKGYPQNFADLKQVITSNDNLCDYYEKTEDGYICVIEMPVAGKYDVKFVKHRDYYSKYYGPEYANYKTIASFNVNCLDYTSCSNKWKNDLIKNNTTEGMTPLEKMKAVSNYLAYDSGYTYLTTFKNATTGDLNVIYLATGEDAFYQPHWINKRWDSYVSPAVLTSIAQSIGGFDSIENLYGKYSYGTYEWRVYHYTCRVVYEGEEYDFTACPLSSTGLIDKIPEINLSDTSSMIRID